MTFWTLIGLLKGKATTKWPKKSHSKQSNDGQDHVIGMPKFKESSCLADCSICTEVCPTKAIINIEKKALVDIDYGKCVNCQLCIDRCPTDAISASNEWAFGVKNRSDLILNNSKQASVKAPQHQGFKTSRFRRSLYIRHIDAGSCNGCESELHALENPFYNLDRFGIFFTPSPRHADLLLITGPVTYNMRDLILETYNAMPDPKWVMAAGTCAVSGGTNGNSYAAQNGIEDLLPVDIYLPGCPPNPAALLSAFEILLNKMPQHVKEGHYVNV
jgi:Ni,Fe-hydrogenase III small subunit/Pyruvate/2-oxoacid:ferredoxin oxidoreductase delta subunit